MAAYYADSSALAKRYVAIQLACALATRDELAATGIPSACSRP
jgi:hypothetical protein